MALETTTRSRAFMHIRTRLTKTLSGWTFPDIVCQLVNWHCSSLICVQVTFINTTNPYLDSISPDFEVMSATSMESPAPFDTVPQPPWRTSHLSSFPSTPSSMAPEYAPTSVPTCYSPDLDALPSLVQSASTSATGTPTSPPASLYNRRIHSMDWPTSSTQPPTDPRLSYPYDRPVSCTPRLGPMGSSRQSPPRSEGDLLIETDHEITFLLRWFSEGPGNWMDLFDFGTYFASYVPVKACENPLLKYAVIACAAKALARRQACRPTVGDGGKVTGHVMTASHTHISLVDWKHKAAVYYDNAVSLLLQALKNSAATTPEPSECEYRHPNGDVACDIENQSPQRRRTSSNASFVSSTDDVLAASAILCVYEFLDTSIPEWAKHLSGAKSLLVLAQEHTMSPQMPTLGSIFISTAKLISKARRATFWNIARQDMLAACTLMVHSFDGPR
jgi:hypothetical protein